MKKTIHTSITYDQARALYHLPDPYLSEDGGSQRAADFVSRWDVTWGPAVNLNPTRLQRLKARIGRAASRLSDACAVAMGRKIAVDEDEYWGDC